jgi:hypothetical protein
MMIMLFCSRKWEWLSLLSSVICISRDGAEPGAIPVVIITSQVAFADGRAGVNRWLVITKGEGRRGAGGGVSNDSSKLPTFLRRRMMGDSSTLFPVPHVLFTFHTDGRRMNEKETWMSPASSLANIPQRPMFPLNQNKNNSFIFSIIIINMMGSTEYKPFLLLTRNVFS